MGRGASPEGGRRALHGRLGRDEALVRAYSNVLDAVSALGLSAGSSLQDLADDALVENWHLPGLLLRVEVYGDQHHEEADRRHVMWTLYRRADGPVVAAGDLRADGDFSVEPLRAAVTQAMRGRYAA